MAVRELIPASGPINVSRDAMLEGALRGSSAIKRSTIILGLDALMVRQIAGIPVDSPD